MRNEYEVRGDITAIFLKRRDGSSVQTVISTSDLPLLQATKISWRAVWDPKMKKFYVQGDLNIGQGRKSIKLHRFLTGAPRSKLVDHLNHDTLDNRRENIRLVTDAENKQNQCAVRKDSKSGVRGVSWHAARGKWRAHATLNKKFYHLGLYESKAEAESAVKKWRRENMPFSEMDRRGVI